MSSTVTAIVTSDNHLGAYTSRMRADRLEERRARLREAFARAVDAAVDRHVDLFLHAGDLFDRPDPRNVDRRFVAAQIGRLMAAGIPAYAIAGNHDCPRSAGYDGGVCPHEELEALGAITFFRGADQLQEATIAARSTSIRVRGMSSDFNRPADSCPLAAALLEPDQRTADIEIALLHYGVEGLSQFEGEPCLSLASLERLAADVICVGHLHRRADIRLASGALLLNPGATEHIHFGEEGEETGFWLLQLTAGRAEAEYIAVNAQRMRTLELDAGAAAAESLPEADGAGLTAGLLWRIGPVSHPDQLLRVRLSGQIERARYHELDPGAVQAEGAARNFHCQVDTDGLAIYDRAADMLVEVGCSFDVREELQSCASALARDYGDDPYQRDLCVDAAQSIAEAYDRFTGGAR